MVLHFMNCHYLCRKVGNILPMTMTTFAAYVATLGIFCFVMHAPRPSTKRGIKETIKDSGIMCSCTSCNGSKVILTSLQFERHVGRANKRAADYIYLENGNNLRSVMNECRDAPLDAFEETIKNAISSAPVCQNCKGAVPALPFMRTVILCTSCLELKKSQASPASTDGTNARWLKPL